MFIYWEMQNGHQHSYYGDWNDFATFAKDTTETFTAGQELTQEEYMQFIKEYEETDIVEIIEIDEDIFNEQKAEELYLNGYIAGFYKDSYDLVLEFH